MRDPRQPLPPGFVVPGLDPATHFAVGEPVPDYALTTHMGPRIKSGDDAVGRAQDRFRRP